VGASEAGIFDAQVLSLEDPELAGEAARIIREGGAGAAFAWESASGKLADRLAALDDPYLRARAADLRDVAARVMRRLTGARATLPTLGSPSILAAHDLAPSEVKELDPKLVLGLCLEMGSASAHSVILARAMGIPAVAGLGPGLLAVPEGTVIAMDGASGSVWLDPGEDRIRDFDERRRAWLENRRLAEAGRKKPAATRDGLPIRVVANISGVAEAAQAVEYGADGVGVLRTEFLFLDREEPPGEEEQLAAYAAIAGALDGRPLVVRTLDIGGDKSVSYVDIGEEANPFLGWRGIRLTLDRGDLLRTQLRAILRAGAEGPVDILLPMVSSLSELRRARAMLAEVEADLARAGLPFQANARVGVMIETPAAVAIADQLAREAAFFSIGSNDLIQYVMVADRTNARVAPMADPFQPAVLRVLRQAIEAGRQAAIEVALCGELAADPLATPLLIGLGLEELSVSAPLVPEVKQAVARWTLAEARRISGEALSLDSSEEVRRWLVRQADS
jgi:phosphocarrier protein FPr